MVFDIDGTLTDSVEVHQEAFKKAIKEIGLSETGPSFSEYLHHTDSYIVRTLYESTTGKPFDEPTKILFEDILYREICKNDTREIEGAADFLKHLSHNTEFGVCFATGSLLKPAVWKLRQAGIDFEPSLLVTANHFEERENIVLKAIENAGEFYAAANFERIISWGDGLWDLKTAGLLALEFIGIGEKHKELLRQNGAVQLFTDFKQVNVEGLKESRKF